MKKSINSFLILFVVILFCSCNNKKNLESNSTAQNLNIIETLQATENLSSLFAAIIEVELSTTLNSKEPITFLAPTNDAFEEFLSSNGWKDITEVPHKALEEILLNHIIYGTLDTATLTCLKNGYKNTIAKGAGGNNMSLYFDTSIEVTFNNLATVSIADIYASNGIVHIVDKVITLPSVVEHANANSEFSNLVAALSEADEELLNTLNNTAPITVLAPNNAAFSAFLTDNGFGDLYSVPTYELSQILLNHVINGHISSTSLLDLGDGYTNSLATDKGLNSMSLYYNTNSGIVFNGVSTVATADVVGTNGIIHAVDAVIGLPTLDTFSNADPNFSNLVLDLTTLTQATDFAAILSRTATRATDGI